MAVLQACSALLRAKLVPSSTALLNRSGGSVKDWGYLKRSNRLGTDGMASFHLLSSADLQREAGAPRFFIPGFCALRLGSVQILAE